jgi:hypothetical protein
MHSFMKDALQQIDPDYYRSAQLLIARADLEQLRRWRASIKRRSKIPHGMWCSTEAQVGVREFGVTGSTFAARELPST